MDEETRRRRSSELAGNEMLLANQSKRANKKLRSSSVDKLQLDEMSFDEVAVQFQITQQKQDETAAHEKGLMEKIKNLEDLVSKTKSEFDICEKEMKDMKNTVDQLIAECKDQQRARLSVDSLEVVSRGPSFEQDIMKLKQTIEKRDEENAQYIKKLEELNQVNGRLLEENDKLKTGSAAACAQCAMFEEKLDQTLALGNSTTLLDQTGSHNSSFDLEELVHKQTDCNNVLMKLDTCRQHLEDYKQEKARLLKVIEEMTEKTEAVLASTRQNEEQHREEIKIMKMEMALITTESPKRQNHQSERLTGMEKQLACFQEENEYLKVKIIDLQQRLIDAESRKEVISESLSEDECEGIREEPNFTCSLNMSNFGVPNSAAALPAKKDVDDFSRPITETLGAPRLEQLGSAQHSEAEHIEIAEEHSEVSLVNITAISESNSETADEDSTTSEETVIYNSNALQRIPEETARKRSLSGGSSPSEEDQDDYRLQEYMKFLQQCQYKPSKFKMIRQISDNVKTAIKRIAELTEENAKLRADLEMLGNTPRADDDQDIVETIAFLPAPAST